MFFGLNFVTIIVLAVILFAIILVTISYIKAAPDEAIIISGFRKQRVIIGGAGLRIPFLERFDKVSLKLFQIDVKTSSPVPTKDYINVSVDAVVTAKISDNQEHLKLSAQNFLNKSIDEIRRTIVDILEGNMREIVGNMPLVDLVSDRKKVSELVLDNAAPDLSKLGIAIQTFNIQNFTDSIGVIKDLGQDRTSAIRKAAAISKANAERDISIAEAEAKKQSNDAQVAADLEIAKKQNDLAVQKANLKKVADTEAAIADAAYEIQKKVQLKQINIAEAEAEVAKQEKEIEIREKMVSVTEKELKAQIEKKAEAEKQAQIQNSEADIYKKQKEADALLYKQQQEAEAVKKNAEAEKQKGIYEADVLLYKQQQEAEAVKKIAEAEKQKGIYEAEVTKTKGLAEAEAIKAKGLAEAEALEKKAEAMKAYGEAARQEMQLKTIEKYFEKLPDIAKAVSTPLGNIKNITMYGEGNNAKLTEDITKTLTQITNGVTDSLGVDLKTVLGSMFGAKLAGVGLKENNKENNSNKN